MSKRVRAYVGLGSNVGDSRANLARAVLALSALPGTRVRAISPLYRTTPVGVADQPDFLNAVVALDVPAGPDPQTGALALLSALKQLEKALGRQQRQRWGPREVDLDLLLFGRHSINVRRDHERWLEVPHPEAHERLFVLAPLADIAPRLSPPGWHERTATARDRRSAVEGSRAAQRVADYDASRSDWIDVRR